MWTRLLGYMLRVPPPPLLALIGRGRTLFDFICSVWKWCLIKALNTKGPFCVSYQEPGPSWFLGIDKGSGLTWISPRMRYCLFTELQQENKRKMMHTFHGRRLRVKTNSHRSSRSRKTLNDFLLTNQVPSAMLTLLQLTTLQILQHKSFLNQ